MSDRKRAEVKIRCTEDEKLSWQQVAEDEQTTLSELIRRELNARALPAATTQAGLERLFATCEPTVIPVRLKHDWSPFTTATPQADVPTSGEVESNEITMLDPDLSQFKTVLSQVPVSSEKASWLNDELKPRRTEDCAACGKPPYVFCRSCDV